MTNRQYLNGLSNDKFIEVVGWLASVFSSKNGRGVACSWLDDQAVAGVWQYDHDYEENGEKVCSMYKCPRCGCMHAIRGNRIDPWFCNECGSFNGLYH